MLNNKKGLCAGFTLIEVLLALALVALLVGVSLPIYYTLFAKNNLDIAKNQVAQSLGRASFLSSASDGDMTWGVKILLGSVIVFKGTNYATGRDATYDEEYATSSAVIPSGLTEVVFNKMTGLPQTTGTIILTSTNGEVRTITINNKGAVSY